MARYEFYQDDKCTLWHRTYYTVEAPSQKEAYALAATITITEKTWDDDIQVEGSEFLFDTLEPMTPDENDRQPTAELYTVEERLIADVLRGPVWEALVERTYRDRETAYCALRTTRKSGRRRGLQRMVAGAVRSRKDRTMERRNDTGIAILAMPESLSRPPCAEITRAGTCAYSCFTM